MAKSGKTPSSISVFDQQTAPDPSDIDTVTGLARVKSFYDYVDQHLQVEAPGKVVRDTMAIFKCSARTSNRCIAEVNAAWKKFADQTRAQRMQRYLRRKETLYASAERKGDERTANTIIETQAETMGDKKPDIHLLLGGDKTPEQLLQHADELRKLTDAADDADE